MILDAELFTVVKNAHNTDSSQSPIARFIAYIEKKLGVVVAYDKHDLPYGRTDLSQQFTLAAKLEHAGILRTFGPIIPLADEPQMRLWGTRDTTDQHAGGATMNDDAAALTAALAEGLERSIWRTKNDYFDGAIRATVGEIAIKGRYIAPKSFASFSEEQREGNSQLRLPPEATYTWIKGKSLVSNEATYVPAQTVSGNRAWLTDPYSEPRIRIPITIGLATWPTRSGAQLAGALEVIEREAYMIMWLNQLTLPHIRLEDLQAKYPELESVLSDCKRYRIKPHVIPMLTDAPVHAVSVILEDMSGNAPRFIIGLKAHRSFALAVEKAITEALRGRAFCRRDFLPKGDWDTSRSVDTVGHYERLYYWSHPQNARKLEFLVSGAEIAVPETTWENLSIEEHLKMVTAWCATNQFDCISVSLSTKKNNPTSWYIEMVVIPQLQHTYLDEKLRQLGGTRRLEVPKLFGYSPRPAPYLDDPHPYA